MKAQVPITPEELDRQRREFEAAWHQFVGPPRIYYEMKQPNSAWLDFLTELPNFWTKLRQSRL